MTTTALPLEALTPECLAAVRDLLDRAGVRDVDQTIIITSEMVEAEIARLEVKLRAQGKPLPPMRR